MTLLAAHLASVAKPSQILLADRVYDSTRGHDKTQSVGDIVRLESVRPVTADDVQGLKEARSPVETGVGALSPRDCAVPALLARGLSNHTLAEEHVVTDPTAAKHIENIFGKLGFWSRAQLAAWATRQGLSARPRLTATWPTAYPLAAASYIACRPQRPHPPHETTTPPMESSQNLLSCRTHGQERGKRIDTLVLEHTCRCM
jgi:DNA-binding CsgD family transcriptional regulator